jgi:hypothetical protein
MNSNDFDAASVSMETAVENSALMGRRRAQSVTSASGVETVVVKAKRAASSLWMLLHSQVSEINRYVVHKREPDGIGIRTTHFLHKMTLYHRLVLSPLVPMPVAKKQSFSICI